jgi:transcriptional regulator with XRE-family HTH domain
LAVGSEELKRLGCRLRAKRKQLGLSLEDVARATEMSPSFLSYVENGKGDISFTRLGRLVALYGLTWVDLAPPNAADDRIVRVGERQELRIPEAKVSVSVLARSAEWSMMPMLCVYERGGGSTGPLPLESEEFIHVLQGSLEISFEDGEEITLGDGDSIYLIEPERARTYRNTNRGRTVTLSVISPPAVMIASTTSTAEMLASVASASDSD